MTTLTYAGIGARTTPPSVLADMRRMAQWLTRQGWHLATGGADGADGAFAGGTPPDRRTLWLPWENFNQHTGPDCRLLSEAAMAECQAIAARLHPSWDRCSRAARHLHARNVAILLGDRLDRPVDACVAWTAQGRVEGGTGMGLRIAQERDIPIFNLAVMTPREVCEQLRDIRLHASASMPQSGSEDFPCSPG